MQSAIESEVQKRFQAGGAWLRSHDRGVLLSLLLSIPPFIQLPVIGLLLAIVNYWLFRIGRLPQSEERLIKITIGIALISIAIGVLVAIQILNLLQGLPEHIPHWVSQLIAFINSIREFIHGNGRFTQT